MSKLQDVILINIPVRPAIKKYLDNNYLLKHNGSLTTVDPVGIYLMEILQRPPRHYKIAKLKTGYEDFPVKIVVDGQYHLVGKTYISPNNAFKLDRFVNKLIKHEFYTYMEARLTPSSNAIEHAIGDFIKRHDFVQEEMNPESLIKLFSRHRKRLKTLKNSAA